MHRAALGHGELGRGRQRGVKSVSIPIIDDTATRGRKVVHGRSLGPDGDRPRLRLDLDGHHRRQRRGLALSQRHLLRGRSRRSGHHNVQPLGDPRSVASVRWSTCNGTADRGTRLRHVRLRHAVSALSRGVRVTAPPRASRCASSTTPCRKATCSSPSHSRRPPAASVAVAGPAAIVTIADDDMAPESTFSFTAAEVPGDGRRRYGNSHGEAHGAGRWRLHPPGHGGVHTVRRHRRGRQRLHASQRHASAGARAKAATSPSPWRLPTMPSPSRPSFSACACSRRPAGRASRPPKRWWRSSTTTKPSRSMAPSLPTGRCPRVRGRAGWSPTSRARSRAPTAFRANRSLDNESAQVELTRAFAAGTVSFRFRDLERARLRLPALLRRRGEDGRVVGHGERRMAGVHHAGPARARTRCAGRTRRMPAPRWARMRPGSMH